MHLAAKGSGKAQPCQRFPDDLSNSSRISGPRSLEAPGICLTITAEASFWRPRTPACGNRSPLRAQNTQNSPVGAHAGPCSQCIPCDAARHQVRHRMSPSHMPGALKKQGLVQEAASTVAGQVGCMVTVGGGQVSECEHVGSCARGKRWHTAAGQVATVQKE